MALCTGELFLWAGQLLEALDDTTTPTGQTVSWLQNNIFRLNMSLGSEFVLSGSCITPDMSQNVSGLYSEMYFCNYFARMANKNLGASAYDWTEVVGDQQGSIRRVSKNEISKSYRLLAKDCSERLQELTAWFNGQQNTYSSQILYGQRAGGANFDLIAPPSCYYNENNFIWNV